MTATRALAVVLRVAFGGLLLTMVAVAASPSCDSSEVPASIDVGSGDTYGAEVSLTVKGRGRVTSSPTSIDCPPDCFTRIVLPSASVDGGDGGITLIAQDTPSSHFVGWSFADVDLGARARGPAQCSPMMRRSTVPPSVDTESTVVSVPFGQAQGTPPAGHEAECAAYTSVSLAYAVTAKFSDDPPEPGFDASVDPDDQDVLFFPVVPGTQADEIGVTGGYAYWRYDTFPPNGLSGIAGSDIASNTASVIVPADQGIRLFDVGRHAAFQYDDGSLWVITGGQLTTSFLGVAPPCLALASDAQNVYCRAALGTGTAIYAWPATGGDAGAPSTVHVLPLGDSLAVDTQRFYFSDDPSFAPGRQSVYSVTRAPDVDGGTSPFTTIASGLTSVTEISVGPTYLVWIEQLTSSAAVSSATKLPGANPTATVGVGGTFIRHLAADPFTDDYWVGVGDDNNHNGFVIDRVPGGTGSPTFFRGGTGDINGLAVDATYVYWTRPNGRVYRAFKNVNDPAPPPPGH